MPAPGATGVIHDNHVIEALASNRSDDTFHRGVLLWGTRCGTDRVDVHMRDRVRDSRKGAVAVMQQISRRQVVRKGISKLLGGSRRGRITGHGDMHDTSPIVGQHDEHEQQAERDGGHDNEVGSQDLAGVIREEGTPRLRW